MVCCENKNGECEIGIPLKDYKSKFAICTLLTNGDSYLPGVMELGWSLKRVIKRKNIDFVLMVTDDVSKESIICANIVYDKIITIPTIEINHNLIPHKDKNTKIKYSKLFTKFGYLLLTQYKKVLYMDADMIVLRKDIVNLFNLNTPAAVFYGCSDAYKDNNYKQTICKYSNHGSKVTKSFNCKRVKEFMAFETSIVLIEPSIKTYELIVNRIKNIKSTIKSDTGMFNMFFGRDIYAINLNFLGRWIDPNLNKNIITIDTYGYLFKPWDKISSVYPDIIFWRKMFYKDVKRNMQNEIIRSNAILMQAYNHIKISLELDKEKITKDINYKKEMNNLF